MTIHTAIIMDGNGRWAMTRSLPRMAGHRAGADNIRRVAEAAPGLGITTLTLFAFSADNWGRPGGEVSALLELMDEYLRREVARCVRDRVRMSFIGRRDRLPAALVRSMRAAESATCAGDALHLRLALDYSARDAILHAARRLGTGEEVGAEDGSSRSAFARLLDDSGAEGTIAPDVDLLIRTGGERRLSDFLLWECAYAELYFTPTMWPDFGARDLEIAVRDFDSRQRRFGGLPEQAAS